MTLKARLGVICQGDHEHETIQGRNWFGPRSQQKAMWNETMCNIILDGILEDLELRTAAIAFPAELVEEDAEAQGPLDDLDEDDFVTLGTSLSDRAEQEQELLDSLKLEGFPEKEQERREKLLKLPRTTQAAIRRLHHLINHKPAAVMIQIMKGAAVDPKVIEGVKFFRCRSCAELEKGSNVSPGS